MIFFSVDNFWCLETPGPVLSLSLGSHVSFHLAIFLLIEVGRKRKAQKENERSRARKTARGT
jgi:hypothetical protein